MNTSTTTATVEAGKMPALPGKPVHIMLDLETLGTAPGSVILSIGACVFDENGPSENPAHRYEVHIDASRSVEAGLEMDASTVLWWLKQDGAARGALCEGQKDSVGPNVACFDFVNWLDKVCPEAKALRVWGKGPSFDCGLLVGMCRKVGARQPWRYSGERCVRSAMELRPDIAEPVREGVHHSALDDALHQARHVGAIMKAMGEEVETTKNTKDTKVNSHLKWSDDDMRFRENAVTRPLLEALEELNKAHDLLRISHDAKAHNYEVQKARADKAEAELEKFARKMRDSAAVYRKGEGYQHPELQDLRVSKAESEEFWADEILHFLGKLHPVSDDTAGGDARAPAGGEDASGTDSAR